MLNSNSKIKKSVTSALMSLTILFAALSSIYCFKASAAPGSPETPNSQSDNSENQNQQQNQQQDGNHQGGIPVVVV